ncbi:phage tail sheath family protein [Cyanobacteria bacterium FACHB-471]|nr:phage tail sheath family protein [Cyanobacteria bacterium FACHB-471]
MARLDYFAPGVYVEEVDRGSRPIEGVPTNVGGFVGFTEAIRNGAEQFKPMLVTSWDQYLRYFSKEGSTGFSPERFYLPFAVQGWFLNGGGRCWVVSLGTQLPKPSETLESGDRQPVPLEIKTTRKTNSLQFSLKPEHAEDGRLYVNISKPETEPPFDENDDSDAPAPLPGEFFDVTIFRQESEELEKYFNLTMNPQAPVIEADLGDPAVKAMGGFAPAALERSQYIDITNIIPESQRQRLPLSLRPAYGTYEVSAPIIVPTTERVVRHATGVRNRQTGIQGTFEVDDINMLAFPDLMRLYEEKNPDGSPVLDDDKLAYFVDLMISLCENAAPNPPNRMVVLDAPPPVGDRPIKNPQQVAEWLNNINRRSMFAALYYPWIKVANPAKEGKSIFVPPCGHMMGVWARNDETRGIHKAPANETPRGVLGLSYEVNFREQELLNPMGINCIRNFPNRGIKVWGARTLVEKEKTEWRYINVRRLMSYIEKSIEEGTQWVVFEPNDQDLWARVRRTVSNFLERLWREGALFGSSPEQAFYVKCDETLNTEETMMLGRLYIEVGVRPVRPAEFVVFRVSQWNGQME